MFIRIKLFLFIFILTFIPILGIAQVSDENQSENLKSSIRISASVQLLLQRYSDNPSNSTLFTDQDKLFFQNPVFGINLEWYGWANVAINSRISYYSGSASESVELPGTGFGIGIPGLYKDNYDFSLLLFEPGLKLTLPFNKFEVFWTGAPSFGFGKVNLDVQLTPIRYENGEAVPKPEETYTMKQEENRSNIGFYFSTGVTLPISSSFRFQAEIGYRNLSFDEFEIPAGQFRFKSLNYQLDSFAPTLGITYIIR